MMSMEEKRLELVRRVNEIGELKKEFFMKLELEFYEEVELLKQEIDRLQKEMVEFLLN